MRCKEIRPLIRTRNLVDLYVKHLLQFGHPIA